MILWPFRPHTSEEDKRREIDCHNLPFNKYPEFIIEAA
jgi:hypothetical protein